MNGKKNGLTGEMTMRIRTNEEIQAYIDGYNDSYYQFCEVMKGRKSVLDAVRKMKLYVDAVNKVREGKDDEIHSDI